VHRASSREILRKLKSDLKERSEEVKVKGNELFAIQTKFPGISDHEIKVYAKVKGFSKDENELWMIFLNGDQSVSSENNFSAYNTAKAYLFEFANRVSREANISNQDSQNKKLNSLKNEQKSLEHQLDKYENKIKKLDRTIIKKQKEIDKIDAKKSLDQKSIELRKKAVEKVAKGKEKIKDLKYDIIINKENQTKKQEEIKNQKEVLIKAKEDVEIFD